MKSILKSISIFALAVLGGALIATGFGGSLYILFWLGLVVPIMTIAAHVDAETLTASIVGKELVFFLCRGLGASVWFVFFALAGSLSHRLCGLISDSECQHPARRRRSITGW